MTFWGIYNKWITADLNHSIKINIQGLDVPKFH